LTSQLRFSTFAVAAIAAILCTLPAGAQMPEPPAGPAREPAPSITVSGYGEMRVAPDLATVRLGVVAQQQSARDAQQDASRIAQAILAGVAALDVPREAVQTSQLILTPVYEQPAPRQQVPTEPRIIAYRAANVVSVRLEDLAKIGRVIDAAIDAGANQVDGVDFQLRNDREAREEALRRAVREARSKAATMAEALGVSLGPVLDAREGGVSVEPPQFATRMFAMEARASETPVSPGEITVSANVTLRYRIGG
jgi:uncharacterized protein YggE